MAAAEIGRFLADAMKKVGNEGVITVDANERHCGSHSPLTWDLARSFGKQKPRPMAITGRGFS
jgi:hypothetical protein